MGDLSFSWRALRRNPGFSLVAILTLALGVGANTAIFSVVKSVLLNPLPYRHPERLMMLGEVDSGPKRPETIGYETAYDCEAPQPFLRAHVALPRWRRRAGGRRRARPAARPARGLRFLRHPRRPHATGPHLPARRGPPGQPLRDHPQRRAVAPPLRRRPEHCRPRDPPERSARSKWSACCRRGFRSLESPGTASTPEIFCRSATTCPCPMPAAVASTCIWLGGSKTASPWSRRARNSAAS